MPESIKPTQLVKSNSLQTKQQTQRFFRAVASSGFSASASSEKYQHKSRPEIYGNENIAKKLAAAALLSMDS
ncbi:hypothetical protein [Legionella drozanskii]|uniref:Uncharacterized protein n=1 Tax=Legionella drozanskii LLAP-1 TaxID=1212489 RepID=A0A0W0SQC1_9GAMM|nr:hypothetical protein [Legionella drozanskii]KTC85475.1 hypothetical protein Ldro_2647 [Legionella drozanskii LLAP-1]